DPLLPQPCPLGVLAPAVVVGQRVERLQVLHSMEGQPPAGGILALECAAAVRACSWPGNGRPPMRKNAAPSPPAHRSSVVRSAPLARRGTWYHFASRWPRSVVHCSTLQSCTSCSSGG